MKVLHFGTYSAGEGYPRNAVIAGALEEAGAEVITCRRAAWGDSASRARSVTTIFGAAKTIFKLIGAWIALAWEYITRAPEHDIVLVGYPGHLDIFIARILAALRSKPVVLDAFLSVYEAVVEDRKLAAPNSVRARLLKLLDRLSSGAAHAVLVDTEAHVQYYRDVIGIEPDRIVRVFVGALEEYFHPPDKPPKQNPGEALFFGSFLPLHGADVIVRAAAVAGEASGLSFTMIGDGPQWQHCRRIAEELGVKISWERDWMNVQALASRIANSEICLGIFSNESKAARVIPCKVFNVLAMGKPLITADTAAAREAITHGENAYLVPAGDPEALAEALLALHQDAELRERIASGGLKLFKERFSRGALGKTLIDELEYRFGAEIGKEA